MTNDARRTQTSAVTTGLWPVAEALADLARAETLSRFRQNIHVDSKTSDFDPVTDADRASEAAMRAYLDANRPDDAVLGEEYGPKPGTSGVTWVLDPIDGTRGFVAGTPTWGVLIAACDVEGPQLGLIDQPYIGERFMGGAGRSVMTGPLGETPLAVRGTDDLGDATILTTFPEVGTPIFKRAHFG
ncbi:MAG: inositol monophosphatase family protein, partial [Pseudomonadota bacterium]